MYPLYIAASEIVRAQSAEKRTTDGRNLTVTPYFRAIPWRVSVLHTTCFTRLSVRVMRLAVLPYFFNAFPVSRMHLRSSISLAPFRSIVTGHLRTVTFAGRRQDAP